MGDSPAFGNARGEAKADGYLPTLESLEVPIVEFTGRRYQRLGHTLADGIIGHGGNGPSGGYPHPLGVLGASDDCFALDLALTRVLNVNPDLSVFPVDARTASIVA